ncbi:MAG TPA: flagellar hook-associated protein FlgK [Steroidobacteraceae bacterium]|nr:flagellar hook-associated protein FlgK [Steroidobacteraceae bacterium]
MADLLSTAVSALQTYRRGLDTTSHNIANVGTTGYSRQRIETVTREAMPYGNGWVGTGVDVSTVRRVYDEFVTMQARSSTTSYEEQAAYASLAERINNLYASSTTGLSATLQKFSNALQSVANAPSSSSARQVMLSEANTLAAQMNSYATTLNGIASELNQRVTSGVNEVNSLATAIADLNDKIVVAQNRTGQPPNDLLDQRDVLLDELSAKVAVTTLRQDDGSINVFIGTGQPLVLGRQASKLVIGPDEFDASRLQVSMQTTSGAVDVTKSLTGGEIGGLLQFRDGMLEGARNSLGQLAVGIASLVNEQQAQGMDLHGQMGKALFAVGGVETLRSANNTGTGSLSVTRADATKLTTSNYRLELAAGTWSLRNADTGAAVPMTGSGTAADPFVADGLEIVVPAGAVDGDEFQIRPTQNAAIGMKVLFTDPSSLAAAVPVIASTASANTGSGRLGELSVVDATNPALRTTASIVFSSPTSYSIDGGPAQTYVPGQPIVANGWSLMLEGTPAAGDTFGVKDNSTGVGDNRNFLTLADRLGKPYLDDGKTSLSGAIGRVVADVGVQTRQAQVSRDALAAVQQDAIAAKDSVSGVNLDEEAANLIRYQQAYQAAAQVVQVANETFNTLLGAIAR